MLFILEALLAAGVTAGFASCAKRRRTALRCGAAAIAAVTALNSFVLVQQNEVAVETWFGRTLDGHVGPGFHWANPFSRFPRYDALRREVAVEATVPSSDGLRLQVTVALATKLNPALVADVRRTVATDHYNTVVVPAATTAVREGFAAVGWVEATRGDPAILSEAIRTAFARIVTAQLVGAGLPLEKAGEAIRMLPVQVRSARIADDDVRARDADRSYEASDASRRADLLSAQAAAAAARKALEGEGLSLLLSKLPAGTSVADAARLLEAEAERVRADAAARAAETGKVGTVVIGGAATAVATPPPAAPAQPEAEAAQGG